MAKIDDILKEIQKNFDKSIFGPPEPGSLRLGRKPMVSTYEAMQPLVQVRSNWDAFVSFIRKAEVVVRAPKFLRKSKGIYYGHINVGTGRGIFPQVFLKVGTNEIQVPTPTSLDTSLMRSDKLVVYQLPGIGWLHGCKLQLGHIPEGVSGDHKQKICELLVEDCGEEKYASLKARIQFEWDAVQKNADELMKAHLSGSQSHKERDSFVTKLSNLLAKSPDLIEVDPDVVLTIFQMDPKELEKMIGFMKRNVADIDVIVEEDVKKAQDLAKVQSVMES